MSQVYAAMPRLEIPPNARETVLSKKGMLRLNLRLSFSNWTFSVCCCLECLFISIMFLYGPHEFAYIEPFQYAVVIAGVCFFYALIIFLTLLSNSRKMNLYGAPLVHGFTHECFYGASAGHQAVNRWEHFTRWKEIQGYFLLVSQGRWVILPKAMWNTEELDELRTIMREKVGKPYRAGV